jgi:hypothetical protein
MKIKFTPHLRRHWPTVIAGVPWLLGTAALASYFFAYPMPRGIVRHIPVDLVRTVLLLAGGALIALLSVPILVGVACLHGFHRRVVIPAIGNATFVVISVAVFSPTTALWLFAIGLITTSLWVLSAWVTGMQ